MTQNDEEVKTNLLLMTNASTPRISSHESHSTLNTATNTPVSEELPLLMSSTNLQDNIPPRTQNNEYEKKDKMCTKVIDDTTLRIYFPKAPNVDRSSQEKSAIMPSIPEKSVSVIRSKDKDKAIYIQGQNLLLIIYHPDAIR